MTEPPILLLRLPSELIRKCKAEKTIPLPLIEPLQPRFVGLCSFDGLKLLLTITAGNTGLAYDIQESCSRYSRQEFYRLVGNSQNAMIGSIKTSSTDYDISPAFFDSFPKFDGDICLSNTTNRVLLNVINYVEVVKLPEPKPNYSGLFKQSLEQLRGQ